MAAIGGTGTGRAQQQKLQSWTTRWLTDELSSLAKNGSWESALSTFMSVGMSNLVQPNTYHYTAVISGCGRAGKWEQSLGIFSMMRQNKVEANQYTFSALIHSCSEGGKPDYALRAYALMQTSGVPANLHTLTAVVGACAKAGYWEKAISVVTAAEEFLVAPNVMTYTAAMDGCRRAGRWVEAMKLLGVMNRTVDVYPNDITWNTLLNTCGVAHAWAPALHVFAAMKSAGFRAVPFTQECLERAFENTHLFGSTEGMHLLQKSHGGQQSHDEARPNWRRPPSDSMDH
jgi:pentatricopeptide repeat domain-containing protein 1